MQQRLVFATDPVSGINYGYFNGITATHAMDAPVPLLFQVRGRRAWYANVGCFLLHAQNACLYRHHAISPPPSVRRVSSDVQYLAGDAAPSSALLPSNGLRNAIEYDDAARYYIPYGAVVDITVTNTDTGEHPIHFHGHPFWIVATSDLPNTDTYAANYARRDVVSVPPLGWATIRIVADNPGTWLVHCHIDWHMAAGLMLTLVEGGDQLTASHIAEAMPAEFPTECGAGGEAVTHHAGVRQGAAADAVEAPLNAVVAAWGGAAAIAAALRTGDGATPAVPLSATLTGLCAVAAFVFAAVARARFAEERREAPQRLVCQPAAADVGGPDVDVAVRDDVVVQAARGYG